MSNQIETIETNPDECNGWVNRETWAAALHLSNDHDLYHAVKELIDGATGYEAGDRIKEWVAETVELVLFPDRHEPQPPEWIRLMISDVGSFWRVEWYDVAASFMED